MNSYPIGLLKYPTVVPPGIRKETPEERILRLTGCKVTLGKV